MSKETGYQEIVGSWKKNQDKRQKTNGQATRNSELKTQNSELKTPYSELRSQNSKLQTFQTFQTTKLKTYRKGQLQTE